MTRRMRLRRAQKSRARLRELAIDAQFGGGQNG
jgi:hypothetical protein